MRYNAAFGDDPLRAPAVRGARGSRVALCTRCGSTGSIARRSSTTCGNAESGRASTSSRSIFIRSTASASATPATLPGRDAAVPSGKSRCRSTRSMTDDDVETVIRAVRDAQESTDDAFLRRRGFTRSDRGSLAAARLDRARGEAHFRGAGVPSRRAHRPRRRSVSDPEVPDDARRCQRPSDHARRRRPRHSARPRLAPLEARRAAAARQCPPRRNEHRRPAPRGAGVCSPVHRGGAARPHGRSGSDQPALLFATVTKSRSSAATTGTTAT